MLSTTKIEITDHARDRYRERIDPNATCKDLRHAVRNARRLGKKDQKRLKHSFAVKKQLAKYQNTSYFMVRLAEKEHVIFALDAPKTGIFILITCWKTNVLRGF